MALVFHRLVQQDVQEVLGYYEKIGGILLADRFFAELETLVGRIARDPDKFHYAFRDVRRANMPKFPYHLLFRSQGASVRILVLRHHKRHPLIGLARK